MFTKLEKLLDGFLDGTVPGYDCMIYYKGKEVFRRFGGFSTAETKTPLTGNERYYIYSCSKPITAAVGLICLDRGLFSLNDKVSDYLPEFANMQVQDGDMLRPAKRDITIQDLFCMTGGFGYDMVFHGLTKCRKELNGLATTKQAMKYIASHPLLFDPGERWEYGLCLDVLVAVIEAVTGERYDDFARNTMFTPLGMNSTTFRSYDTQGLADLYFYHEDTKIMENCGRNLVGDVSCGKEYESGGGGAISSTEDCMRFLEALRISDIPLKRETVKLMTTNHLTQEQIKSYWMPGYGYGLGVKCSIGNENCADWGWGGMAGALMSVDPLNELSIVYIQHVLYAQNNMERYMIPGLAREALGLSSNPESSFNKKNSYV